MSHIMILSDQEAIGGAAVAACRLAEGLAVRHRVSRCVLFAEDRHHAWHTEPLGAQNLWDRVLGTLGRGLRRRWPRWMPPASRGRADRNLRAALHRLKPDVINIHNLHAGTLMGWSVNLVRICAEFAPVVWTLHDMWSFTGRCAYSYDCRLFESGCDARCPTAQEYPELAPARIRPAWEEKQQLFRQLPRLTAVSPSRWLAQEAERGFWAGHRVEVIPNGLPLATFRPLPRADARRALGLDGTGPIVLVSAHLLTDRRKGGDWLPRIWEHVRTRPVTLLAMGQGRLIIPDAGVRVVSLGYVGETEKIVQAYNAADAVLHAAPVDNLPNVAVEAVACGTPVIGMPVGGVAEIIVPGVSGWLSQQATLASLGEAVTRALGEIEQGQDLRHSCRTRAEQEYAADIQAARYGKLFTHLIGNASFLLNHRA